MQWGLFSEAGRISAGTPGVEVGKAEGKDRRETLRNRIEAHRRTARPARPEMRAWRGLPVGRDGQGVSSAGSRKRGAAFLGQKCVCVCVQEFCPERTGKELNKYTSRREGNVSTLGIIFF